MPHQEEDPDFRTLIEYSPDAILVHDLEGNILYANPAALTLARDTSLEDATKRSVFDYIPKGIAEPGREAIQQLLEGETLPPVIAPLFLVNGDRIEVEVRLNLINFRGHQAVLVHLRDISRQKMGEVVLRERLETERALINFPTDMMIILDDHGIILNVNENFASVLGKSPQDLLGECIWNLMPPPISLFHRETFEKVIQSKQTDRFEEYWENRWYDILVNPVLSSMGTIVCVAVTAHDITDRKRVEKELKESFQNLKKSNEDLELFAHIAAHDLQEPIRTIVAFSELLLIQCKEGTSPLTEKYLRNIEHAGLRMHQLVSDLRRYSDVRAHGNSLELADMEGILASALNNLQLVIEETRASVTHDLLPAVQIDRVQAIQVFQNLIENAIKFRKEGVLPEIHISVSSVDDMWQFAVKDNGIGIQHQYYEKIFVLFERLNYRDAFSGTGLGLALCKRIIERHRGRIWVESEVGTGSTFYFTLPAA